MNGGFDIPTDPAGRDAMAGEYVLGTLDASSAAAMTVALRTDPELRAAVAAWEARLAPFAELAPPRAPPDLWARIDVRTAPARLPSFKKPAPVILPPRLWRAWAVGATLAAAALAAALLARAPDTRFMTVLATDRAQPAWIAEMDQGGRLRLIAVDAAGGARANRTPPDRVLELWAQAPDAAKPASLGVLARDDGVVTVSGQALRPVAGMLIMLSLEPPGGSPTGQPSGPVQFTGRLGAVPNP